MVHQRRRRPARVSLSTPAATYDPIPFSYHNFPSSSSSSAYSLPSVNCDASAVAAGKVHHLNFSLIDDIDALCKKDPDFLAVLPEAIKRRILKIWAEDVKDYRFYGEEQDDVADYDTEVY